MADLLYGGAAASKPHSSNRENRIRTRSSNASTCRDEVLDAYVFESIEQVCDSL